MWFSKYASGQTNKQTHRRCAILHTYSGVFAFSILVMHQRTYGRAKEAMLSHVFQHARILLFFQRIIQL